MAGKPRRYGIVPAHITVFLSQKLSTKNEIIWPAVLFTTPRLQPHHTHAKLYACSSAHNTATLSPYSTRGGACARGACVCVRGACVCACVVRACVRGLVSRTLQVLRTSSGSEFLVQFLVQFLPVQVQCTLVLMTSPCPNNLRIVADALHGWNTRRAWCGVVR